MRVLSVRLENDAYDALAGLAGAAGKPPEVLASEAVAAWLADRAREAQRAGNEGRSAYVAIRVSGKDPVAAAAALGLSREVVDTWDREIRGSPAAWTGAFSAASRSVDPLTWEMTTRERFYGIWGHRPKPGG